MESHLIASLKHWMFVYCAVAIAVAGLSPTYGQSVKVLSLSGSEVQGELKSLDDASLSVARANNETTTLATNELSYLSVAGAESSPKVDGLAKVQLVDGSLLMASDILGGKGGWQVKTNLQSDAIQVASDLVSNVQFVNLPEQAQKTWTTIIQSDRTSDVLAVLRDGDLESLNGALLNITADKVEFELDGQPIKAPRAKVAGLIWLRRNVPTVAKATELTAKEGSSFRLKNVKLSADAKTFDLETAAGLSLKLPFDSMLRIDYSTANLQWLDQLKALESVSLSSIANSALGDMRNKLLAPKFIQTIDNAEAAEGEAPRANLVFDGPGRFVFRAPDGYTRLVTTIERKRSANALLPTIVTIKCDDKEVWSHKLDGEEMRFDVQAKVEPNKKCEITVACDGPIPFGSYTVLAQPHLLP